MRATFLLPIFLAGLIGLLVSCVPKTGEDAVDVKTDGIFDPVTFTIVGGKDLGEILTGSDPRTITMTVKNNSKFEITNLDLTLFDDDTSDMGMVFAAGEDTGQPGFPGTGGTCVTAKLASGATCSIKVTMNPARSGIFKQKILFKYKNFIKTAEYSDTMTVLIGEPASLVFPSEVSFYNYGVLEQTEPIVRTEVMRIENRGGLSARNVDLSVLSADLPSSFVLMEHNCPTVIKSLMSCEATVSYVPLNILVTDPPKDYSATFTASYIKDGKSATGNLNAFFSYKSLKIQGVFETNQAVHEFTPDIIVGNHESKNIAIINKGYQEGVVKELIFKKSDGTLMGVCTTPAGSGPFLDCTDGADPATPVDLATLPFRVEDLSACMDVATPGIRGETLGESCIYRVTFWPSLQYLTDRDFTGTELWFKYDSRWKNQETIITTKLFTFNANSKAAGKLIIQDFKVNNIAQTNESVDETSAWFDLGRLALITDSAYRSSVSITLYNAGNSRVTVLSVFDGQSAGSGPQQIDATPRNIHSQSDSAYDTYYESMITGCNNVEPAEFCTISGYISPIHYTEALDNRLYFDEITIDGGTGKPDPALSFKRFHITYRDSATYEDDGTPHPDRALESKHTGTLVMKGFLVFKETDPNFGVMGTMYPWQTKTHRVVLKNVGTGSIPYINIDAIKNLYYFNGPYPIGTYRNGGPSGYPYNIIPTPGAPYDHDCVDFISAPGGGSVLAQFETCALTVLATADPLERMVDADFNTPALNETRHNISARNNTADLWEWKTQTTASTVTFQYYDGDSNQCPVGPCSGPLAAPGYDNALGFKKAIPRDYMLNCGLVGVGKLTPVSGLTPIDSAIAYRPAMNYPTLSDPPAGTGTQAGYDVAPLWFDTVGATEPVSRHILSKTHVAALVSASDDYTFHGGTFPATGETHLFSFTLANTGVQTVTIRSITFSPGLPAGLTVAGGLPALPLNINVGASVAFTFNFTPNTVLAGNPEIFSTLMDVTYDDGYHKVSTANPIVAHYRIMAEAFETADTGGFSNTDADDDVKSKDWFVQFNNPGTSEFFTGAERNIPLKTHNFDPAFNDTYFAVKGSAVYAKKTYTLKNNTAFPFRLNVFIKTQMGATASADAVSGYELLSNTCNKIMNPTDTCTFDIKFTASASTPATNTAYVHLNYDLQANQFINKAFRVTFTASDPANLTASGLSKFQTLETGSGTGSGYTWSSYSVSYGALAANPHIKQTTYPTIGAYPMTAPANGVTIANSSILKASFLKQLANPPACSNPPTCSGPTDNKIEMWNGGPNGQIHVFATRGCFYGDDEFDGGVPADQKGFNNATSVPNACKLFFEYWSDETFTGTDLLPGNNMMHLTFYNNRWSSFDVMHFHLSGFIEPDFSTLSGGTNYSNVQASSSGSITFNWPTFTGANAVWGNKIGYRIFWATAASTLNNIYPITSNYTDVGPTTHTFTHNGLVAGKYYYYRVAARRQKGAKVYTSRSTVLGTLTAVVPPANTIFTNTIGANGALIDKGLIPGFGFKAAATSACAAQKYTLNNGGTVYKTKALINTTVWNFIKSDPDQTNFSTYSNYVAPATPHWLSDAATGIAPIFTPYGFSTLNLSQYVPKGPPPATPLLYRKICTNTSCDTLDKMVGGDGVEVPFDAVFYIKADQSAGAYRCYAPL
ncbi:MAG: hypothetical protein A2X86_03520 [Bdellovibrionales bacterium GWA2_49_15]|nr:MAG: hypothetical protein A2X86_03520 [Bdellovibrionales bacterium GWA2_49_15]HAZ12285.1 hypothetical protein [Bdellovibrionales bacterium]